MRRDLRLDEKGAHDLPLIILFGVIFAFLLAALFISVYNQQLDQRVDEQAGALSNELAQAAFTSLSGGQPTLELPRDLGGSPYSITVQDNSIFVVAITGGRRAGSSYPTVVNATLMVEDGNFQPSGRVFFMRSSGKVIVSASSIEARPEEVIPRPTTQPPPFYSFAKENRRAAAAIAAAYFDAKTRYPNENIDVENYREEDANSILLHLTIGSRGLTMRARGSDNDENVGKVENAWIVELLENAVDNGSPLPCPSPDAAYLSGWLYSPQFVFNQLRSRTWHRASDNSVVTVAADAIVKASAVTTNVSTYPAWRITFGIYTLYYHMISWGENETVPGFLFQSSPEINPII